MNEDQCSGGQFERALGDLARLDPHVINGAVLQYFVREQTTTIVQKQHAELLHPLA